MINLRLRFKQSFSSLTVKPHYSSRISNRNLNYFKLANNLDILISGEDSYRQISGYLNEFTSKQIIYNPRYENG